MGGVSLLSERSARSPTSPGRVSERQVLPLLGLGRVLPKNAESLRNSDALMRVAVPRCRGPAGLRDLFATWWCCCFFTLCAVLSERARWGWYHYPRSVPHVSETLRGRGLKRQTLPLLGLGRWCSQRTQRAFGTAMRLCASLFRGVAAPLGCATLLVYRGIYICERSCGVLPIFQSSKRKGEGVGIQSVRHIAEKSGGVSTVTYQDGLFCAKVMLRG